MEQQAPWRRSLETKTFLQQQVPDFQPRVGIVLGSGLGHFAEGIEVVATIPYKDIPHFKPTTVVGHSGNLIFGRIGGKNVVCQQGRYHYYEGHRIEETVFPIRVMKALGVDSLVISNAAGGINPALKVGDIMLIADHINFQGANALVGPNIGELGPRFPDMTYGYDPDYRALMARTARKLNIDLRNGVYLSVSGPSYETPAEIRMFRLWGADAVGMSTVNEVIAANHCGLRVVGLSCISNAAAGMSAEKLDHNHVEQAVSAVSESFEKLVAQWVREL